MKKQPKQATLEQLEATDVVYKIRESEEYTKNDNELSELLGVSKVTLYTRLRISNWKTAELSHIESLSKKFKIS